MHIKHTVFAPGGPVVPGYLVGLIMAAFLAVVFIIIIWPVMLAEIGFKVDREAFSSEAMFMRTLFGSAVLMLGATYLLG